jgi:hypothetical protein
MLFIDLNSNYSTYEPTIEFNLTGKIPSITFYGFYEALNRMFETFCCFRFTSTRMIQKLGAAIK